jgi:outer membrane protein TolC
MFKFKILRKLRLLSILLILSISAIAQQPTTGDLSARPSSFEEYLVQLALKSSPEVEGAGYEIEARKQEIELAKKDWTRNLNAAVNLNDVSLPYFLRYNVGIERIDTARFSRIATYPLWQVGFGVNFGDLLNRKHKVKFAENRRKISETDQTLKRQKIRAEILKRYQEYLSAQDVLKIRLQSLDVAEVSKTQISNLFSVNKASFEDYNQANKSYFDALEGKLKAQSDVKIKIIGLEEMIGVKWDKVEAAKATYDKK